MHLGSPDDRPTAIVERIARLRGRRAASQLHAGRGGIERHADRDQPSDPTARARTRRAAVHPAEPRAGIDAAGAGNICPGIRAAFNDLRLATDRLRRRDNDHVLTVSTLASLAVKWLMPRLSAFQEAHPGIDVRITTSTSTGGFPQRRCRCRDPLRARPMARPARRLADGGRAVSGLQSGAADGQRSRCVARRISPTTRCCIRAAAMTTTGGCG